MHTTHRGCPSRDGATHQRSGTQNKRFAEGAPKQSRSGWGDSAAKVGFRAEAEGGLPPAADEPSASCGLTRSVRGEATGGRLHGFSPLVRRAPALGGTDEVTSAYLDMRMPVTVVSFAKALADPTRVRVLGALRAEELCVCELVDALALPQSTLSTHLQVLRRAGLVHVRRRHKWAYYRLAPDVAGLIEAVFTHFGGDARLAQTLEQDRERLSRRLACRVDGCCVIAAPILSKNPIRR